LRQAALRQSPAVPRATRARPSLVACASGLAALVVTSISGAAWPQGTLKPTKTEAALKLFVVDKDEGPIVGLVVALKDDNGKAFYTPETNAEGFTEILVPNDHTYDLTYLSLGRSKKIKAQIEVTDEPRQKIKFTLRYKWHGPEPLDGRAQSQRFVLGGVTFATGKATLKPESYDRLVDVVIFMRAKPRSRVEISGHTDNRGNAQRNQKLSERRAKAVKAYLVSKGIDADRIEAVGFGDARPVADNDTAESRTRNRRIEAREL